MISLSVFITVIATEQNLYIFLTLNYVTDGLDARCTKMKLMVSDGVRLMNSAICWLLCLSKNNFLPDGLLRLYNLLYSCSNIDIVA